MFNAGGANSAFSNALGFIAPFPTEETIPSYVFKDDEYSILYPAVEESINFYELQNVCRAIYSSEDEALWAEAINNDPESDISIPSLGYEKTLYLEVDNVEGETLEDRINSLMDIAAMKLNDNTARIEYMTIKNPYCGLSINQNIQVNYGAMNKEFSGNITNMKIELKTSIPTTTKARKYSSRMYEIFSIGGWIIKESDE